MTVGIVGLGLIGGSMARAYKASGDWRVLALDRDETTLSFSMLAGVVDAPLTKENLGECDLVLIALYPFASCEYIKENAEHFNKNAFVIDLCGTKELVCEAGFAAADEYGFTFVGGHPMAGTHNSGFKYSRANMFSGAPMVIVPPRFDDMELLDKIKNLLAPCGFGKFSVTTAKQHDKTIAFTSQLAHVVSNAYVKSPTAQGHKGFSAGSYKDLTRVAKLNEYMWAELFLENRENMLFELDSIIGSLQEYRDAINDNDFERLKDILKEGRILKEQVDGK
ncbi:MAG: prephenate dehydrogenase [Clostridia bacterium]|nr:prephenate dehydrogenase [Clostridia bacterium]